MSRLAPFRLLVVIAACGVTGCLIETETAIKPDPKVDPRLEGVWQITKKLPNEIRGDRDEDDIGVQGYIIIAPLENADGSIDAGTYKALAFDSFGRDEPSNFPEMLVSTRKHKGHDLLLVRLADHERKKANEGERTFKNWVVDYEFNKKGELFLRFWFISNFGELQKAHPMEFDAPDEAFDPVTLKGGEAGLLGFYTDPKVRALLTAMGKYRRLQPPKR